MTLREFIIKSMLSGELKIGNTYPFSSVEHYYTFWRLVEEEHGEYFGDTHFFFKNHPEYLKVTRLERLLYENN